MRDSDSRRARGSAARGPSRRSSGGAARVARLPPAAAALSGPLPAVGKVGVEPSLDCPRCQSQGLLPHVQFERLDIDPVRRCGGYEAVYLGFERRGEGELQRADFFLTALVPFLSRDRHRSSLTSISSATRRRRRWHSAI